MLCYLLGQQFVGMSMNILRQKNQTFEQCKNMLALLVLSGLFGVLISLVANYFVMTVKWFATLRFSSNSFFDINGLVVCSHPMAFLAVFALYVIEEPLILLAGTALQMQYMHVTALIMNLDLKTRHRLNSCSAYFLMWRCPCWSIRPTCKFWRHNWELCFSIF